MMLKNNQETIVHLFNLINHCSDLKISIASIRILINVSSLPYIKYAALNPLISILEGSGWEGSILNGFKHRLSVISADSTSLSEVLKILIIRFFISNIDDSSTGTYCLAHFLLGFSHNFTSISPDSILRTLSDYILYSVFHQVHGIYTTNSELAAVIWELFSKLLTMPLSFQPMAELFYKTDCNFIEYQLASLATVCRSSFENNQKKCLIHLCETISVFFYKNSSLVSIDCMQYILEIMSLRSNDLLTPSSENQFLLTNLIRSIEIFLLKHPTRPNHPDEQLYSIIDMIIQRFVSNRLVFSKIASIRYIINSSA